MSGTGGTESLRKEDVLDVFHNALELKDSDMNTDMASFDQFPSLPYVWLDGLPGLDSRRRKYGYLSYWTWYALDRASVKLHPKRIFRRSG